MKYPRWGLEILVKASCEVEELEAKQGAAEAPPVAVCSSDAQVMERETCWSSRIQDVRLEQLARRTTPGQHMPA